MKKFRVVLAVAVALLAVAWRWSGYKQLNDSTFADVWVETMASSAPVEEFYTLIRERGWTKDDVAAYTVGLLADEYRLDALEESIRLESTSAALAFKVGYLPAFKQAAFGY